MSWYNKNKLKDLDIIFNGSQEIEGKIVGDIFTDNKTKSSFFVRNGGDIEQALRKIREKFHELV